MSPNGRTNLDLRRWNGYGEVMGDGSRRFELKPIRQQRIYQIIIAQIIDLIRQDKLRVGEKLPPERTLAEMFNVSRPSVREALRVMEVIGLIERKPGGGSHITDLNIAHFLNMISPIFLRHAGFEIELLEMRFLLEIRAVELASRHASMNYRGELDEHIARMQHAFDEDDLAGQSEADIAFHRTIFKLSDNYVLQKASEFVVSMLERSVTYARGIILEGGYGSERLLEQHVSIWEAIRSGDPVQARKAMEEHMNLVLEFHMRQSDESPDTTAPG
jgi:GntR family transcriptional repressor for pyruvate dehydrogenase complex